MLVDHDSAFLGDALVFDGEVQARTVLQLDSVAAVKFLSRCLINGHGRSPRHPGSAVSKSSGRFYLTILYLHR